MLTFFEWWEYDGTNDPVKVMDAWSGTEPTAVNDYAVYDNKLFFSAQGVGGTYLYSYDEANSPDVVSTTEAPVAEKIVYNNKLYFSGYNAVSGREIYYYDGASVQTLGDLNPGTANTQFASPILFNNQVYFRGNDSLNLMELFVMDCQLDLSITIEAGMLASNDMGGTTTYQWVDCVSGQDLTGETASELVLTANGTYAVVIDNGVCSDTSECILIDDLLVTELNSTLVRIFPNPAKNKLFIQAESELKAARFVDLQGGVVLNVTDFNNPIDISSLKAGCIS